MAMDIDLIEQYLNESEAEFDRILAAGEKKRRIVRWTTIVGASVAATVALLLWLAPDHLDTERPLTHIQIAEGIEQMMLLDIGDIESIVATPKGGHAILTAQLKDGSTCSYILICNDDEGTTSLLAYTNSK